MVDILDDPPSCQTAIPSSYDCICLMFAFYICYLQLYLCQLSIKFVKCEVAVKLLFKLGQTTQ